MNNETKSKLVFDMRIVRNLLKRNNALTSKYCRYCGVPIEDGCDCKQPNEVIDVKPLRGNPDATVAVFADTPSFRDDYNEIYAEIKERDNIAGESVEIED